VSDLTIVRKTMGVTVAHTFFTYPDAALRADIQQVSQVSEPRKGWTCTEFSTLLLDLRRDEEGLWGEVKSGCRQEIRRARDRDGLTVDVFDAPGKEEVADFLRFYDASARVKGIGSGDARVLARLADGSGLSLGRVASADGTALAWHAYVVAAGRARLLHSAIRRDEGPAESAALRGRANRLLHWSEICHFRGRGLLQYDFGGLALGAKGGTLAGIDAFKKTFGGETAVEFKCRRAASVVGRLALGAVSAMIRARQTVSWMRGTLDRSSVNREPS
jgi:hypothetical protein